MGFFRKVTSVSTLGLVDFRSDKERTAAYTKRSAKEARKQTALQTAQLEHAKAQSAASTPSQGPPPGWYQSPDDPPGVTRWWDGTDWGSHTQGRPVSNQPAPAPPRPARSTKPEDWYRDPSGRFDYRYWDGSSWTEQVANDGDDTVATDPVGP